jgi:cytoskeletal protein CcmA (bactofilin family)
MSSISEGLKIKGEVQGTEDLRVDGEIEGRINLPGASVVIGPKGRVTGDVEAREVVLEGTTRGNLTARERVRIATTGKLEGDVTAERLVIEEGAHVSGRVDVGAGEARAAKPAAARPATPAGAPAATPSAPRTTAG